MTPEEHFLLQMNARSAAQEIVLHMLVSALCKHSEPQRILRASIAEKIHADSVRTMPGTTADYSMLLAGETAEAFEDLANSLLDVLNS